jgi:hypothetical protein
MTHKLLRGEEFELGRQLNAENDFEAIAPVTAQIGVVRHPLLEY